MSEENVKLCIDCEHYRTWAKVSHYCRRKIKDSKNLVHGREMSKGDILECFNERHGDGECGEDAKFFNPKGE